MAMPLQNQIGCKKVCFKDLVIWSDVEMVVDLTLAPTLSQKDKLLGKGLHIPKRVNEGFNANVDDDFSLLEGDVKKLLVNGIPSIEFSKRVHKLLVNVHFGGTQVAEAKNKFNGSLKPFLWVMEALRAISVDEY